MRGAATDRLRGRRSLGQNGCRGFQRSLVFQLRDSSKILKTRGIYEVCPQWPHLGEHALNRRRADCQRGATPAAAASMRSECCNSAKTRRFLTTARPTRISLLFLLNSFFWKALCRSRRAWADATTKTRRDAAPASALPSAAEPVIALRWKASFELLMFRCFSRRK